jgi:hypothetical protein
MVGATKQQFQIADRLTDLVRGAKSINLFSKKTDDEVVPRLTEPITRFFERRRDLHNKNVSH